MEPSNPRDDDDDAGPSGRALLDAPARPLSPADKEPASGPERTGQPSSSSSPSTTRPRESREKRKRSRVTPEQLTHLEQYFAADRSPTASRRKEISDFLGMQERQTQIWFQNRRAKAKLINTKRQRGDWTDSGDGFAPLSPVYENDLAALIHEDDPVGVTLIPCSDLTIGSWRRIATAAGRNDLVAYICNSKRCITWFIHAGGYGYKMEIPFDTILDTRYVDSSPGQILLTLTLSHPPTFFLEETLSPTSASASSSLSSSGLPRPKLWKKCPDWTENMQATTVMRHDLIGSAPHLMHFLQLLQNTRPSPAPGLSYVSPASAYPSSAGGSSLRLPTLPHHTHALALDTVTRRPTDFFGLHTARSPGSSLLLDSGRKRAFSSPTPFNPAPHLSTSSPLSALPDDGGGGSSLGFGRESSEPLAFSSNSSAYGSHLPLSLNDKPPTASSSLMQQLSSHQHPHPHALQVNVNSAPSLLSPDFLIPPIASSSHQPQSQSQSSVSVSVSVPPLPPPSFGPSDYSTVPISHRSLESRSYPVPDVPASHSHSHSHTHQQHSHSHQQQHASHQQQQHSHSSLSNYFYPDPGPMHPTLDTSTSALLQRRSAPDISNSSSYHYPTPSPLSATATGTATGAGPGTGYATSSTPTSAHSALHHHQQQQGQQEFHHHQQQQEHHHQQQQDQQQQQLQGDPHHQAHQASSHYSSQDALAQ